MDKIFIVAVVVMTTTTSTPFITYKHINDPMYKNDFENKSPPALEDEDATFVGNFRG